MNWSKRTSPLLGSALLVAWAFLSSCSSSKPTASQAQGTERPDLSKASFSNPSRFTNPYTPFAPGTTRTYYNATEDGVETIVVEALEETRTILGVECRVVRDRVYLDELLLEDTQDWFAQDDAGNVWYFGEAVINYEYDDEDEVVATDSAGSWEAGQDIAGTGQLAEAGILVKAVQRVGDAYYQEYYAGEAEDETVVLALDVPITLSDGRSFRCLHTRESTGLEPGVTEDTYWAPGVGVVLEVPSESDEMVSLAGTFAMTDESLSEFDPANFTSPTTIDHPYLPLIPGSSRTYTVETEDGLETIFVEVLFDTREVGGVECVVVRDRVFLDDVLIEDTHDWFAQDDGGNVWYLGEEVDNYNYDDEGELVDIDHEGSWETGLDVADAGAIALPGFQLPASLVPGESYYQEFYEEEAEDMGAVVLTGQSFRLESGASYEDCIVTLDWNPLEPASLEHKVYAPGVGLILEESVGTDERVELESRED